mmetsp:Transcript_1603/g.4386  ORF Transcript_1603/g.4386 Transcript_1603/m.4386 type:complete len:250 (-) Transcript_1603:378-1127(-)
MHREQHAFDTPDPHRIVHQRPHDVQCAGPNLPRGAYAVPATAAATVALQRVLVRRPLLVALVPRLLTRCHHTRMRRRRRQDPTVARARWTADTADGTSGTRLRVDVLAERAGVRQRRRRHPYLGSVAEGHNDDAARFGIPARRQSRLFARRHAAGFGWRWMRAIMGHDELAMHAFLARRSCHRRSLGLLSQSSRQRLVGASDQSMERRNARTYTHVPRYVGNSVFDVSARWQDRVGCGFRRYSRLGCCR